MRGKSLLSNAGRKLLRLQARLMLPVKLARSRYTNRKSILFFTVHKAASMFIHEICRELTNLNGMVYYSPNPGDVHLDEQSYRQDPDVFKGKKGCFAPLRYFVDIPNKEDYSIILHLRDPRDVLVSKYYSRAYSHPRIVGVFNPSDFQRQRWRDEGIDRFVLGSAEGLYRRYQQYCDHMLHRPGIIFVRYEEMVSHFDKWLKKIIKPFGIKDEKKVVVALTKKYGHIFTEKRRENIQAHIRRVTPHDYLNKLKPETIHNLNIIFKDILTKLDYEIDAN